MGELVNYNLNNKIQINLISIAYPSSVKCKIIFSLINKFVPELINLYSVFFSMLMWVFKFKFDKFVDYGNSSWNFCFFFKSCHSKDLGTRMLKVDREKKENEQGRNERITWTALQRNRLVKIASPVHNRAGSIEMSNFLCESHESLHLLQTAK